MQEQTPPYTTVRVNFDPYSHLEVRKFLSRVHQDFGKDKSRWYYRSPDISNEDLKESTNVWSLDFVFRNPYDATIFSLKYLE